MFQTGTYYFSGCINGGTVATIGFPDPSLQGFSPKLAKGEIA
jgi:hypothetical protein